MASLRRKKHYAWLVGGASVLIAAEILWGGLMMTAAAGESAAKEPSAAANATSEHAAVTPTPPAAPAPRTAIEEYEIPDILRDVTVTSAQSTETGYTLICTKGKDTWILVYKAGEKQPVKMAHFAFKS